MLGDPHNFGRRVTRLSNGLVNKPRCLTWEWLFLGSESPLRATVDQLASQSGLNSPFETFPRLRVSSSNPKELLHGGTVEFLQLHGLTSDAPLTAAEAESIGQAIGVCAWFGLSDLHDENIAFGRTRSGRLIWGPLDIESAFADFDLLSQTILVAVPGIAREIAGLSRVIGHVAKSGRPDLIANICSGYLAAFNFLNTNQDAVLQKVIETVDICTLPNRLIIRPTQEYCSFLKNQGAVHFAEPMCAAELEQLERGDVPYYFQYPGRNETYAYDCKSSPVVVNLPITLTGKLNLYECRLADRRPVRENLEALYINGVMQLARAFDEGQTFLAKTDSLQILYSPSRVDLRSKSGLSATVRRRSTTPSSQSMSTSANRVAN